MNIGVIGSGSYGTCLAVMLGGAGHDVVLWARSPELAEEMERTRENVPYLPGAKLPDKVTVTADIARAMGGKQMVVGVTPSHAIRDVLGGGARWLDPDVIVVNCSKGLEEGTLDRIDQIYADIFAAPIAARACYLSGPTFAKEIATGHPAAIVLAARDAAAADRAQAELSTDRLRVYTSDDVIGVLIGGALKNVVAIAAGMSDGLGFGHNTRAALITRGLAEIARMGVKLGANPLTFQGLSGIGDLVLTCSGDLSRNRQVGLALGRGQRLAEVVAEMRMVAEGVKTTKVAHDLSQKLGVPAPITEAMHQVLYQDAPARDAMRRLMGRSLRSERD
ncbi:MAG TPA: NAD(P)H-dependent glycerol-3-phosphate dehydrogenase [Kofleriaceae bacterium]|nr:NAD(P)H-dependent glycerol-3-phosphate dehydrogenase [Kofleriaceae bacterium]